MTRATLVAIACLLFCMYILRQETPTPGASHILEPVMAAPDKSDVILVIAPHCDDETLGAGGLLFDSARGGTRAYVVVMTNGDGFTLAARREFLEIRTDSAKLVEFGYLRQRESLEALNTLGIPESNVFFLGYPDRGLAALWHDHWDESDPYVSKYTRASATPYANSYCSNASYCGAELVQILQDIIMKTGPTIILTSAPVDGHADHWATYNFVVYACEDLREKGLLPPEKPRILWYVVHRGKWPYPKGLRPDIALWPPRGLGINSVRWLSYCLSEDAVLAKSSAIRKYRSQMLIMARYLLSFARTTELFVEAGVENIPRVTGSPPHIDGSLDDWPPETGLVPEPVNDSLLTQFRGAGDFTGTMAAMGEDNLYLAFRFRNAASKEIVYRVHLHPVGARGQGGLGGDIDFTFRPGRRGAVLIRSTARAARDLSGIRAATQGRIVEMTIPLRLLGSPGALFVAAESRLQGIVIDRTMWRILGLRETRLASLPGRLEHTCP